MSAQVYTLWVLEDNTQFRAELVDVLNAEPDLHVAHSFPSAVAMYLFLKDHPEEPAPDVVLMDIRMPEIDGMSATSALKQRFDGQKVIILSAYNDPDRFVQAIRAGAVSYIVKSMPIDQILMIIRNAIQGAFYIAAPVARQVLRHMEGEPVIHLSPRESQVFQLLANGSTQKEIALMLGISPDTVNNHVRSIFSKLEVNSAPAAVSRAHQIGIL